MIVRKNGQFILDRMMQNSLKKKNKTQLLASFKDDLKWVHDQQTERTPQQDQAMGQTPQQDQAAMGQTPQQDQAAMGQTPQQDQAMGQTPQQDQVMGQTPQQDQVMGQTPQQDQAAMGQTPQQDQAMGQTPQQDQAMGQAPQQDQAIGQTPQQDQMQGLLDYEFSHNLDFDWDIEDHDFDPDYVPSEVEDSYESDDSSASEIFPFLNTNKVDVDPTPEVLGTESNQISNESCESDGDDTCESEQEIEEEILRDVNNKGLYIKKVIKDSTSKTGKKKKIDRVYNSYNYCGLCKMKVSNFAQHIARNRKKHDNCKEIEEIQQEQDMLKKKTLLKLLRAKFNHHNNMKSLKKGKGEIFLERRPTAGTFSVEEFGPCPKCLLWISKSLLQKHQEKCLATGRSFSTTAEVTTISDTIAQRISPSVSKKLQEEVLTKMKMDEVGTIARQDPLIIQLGNQWLEKNIGNPLKRGPYTSQIMRLVARLLRNLRKVQPLDDVEQSLWNYLKPEYLDVLIKAALLTASPSQDDEDDLEKPSNALKLGYDLKRLINGKIGRAILEKDTESRKDAEDLLKAVQIYWGTRVTKLARVIIDQRHYVNQKALPDPQDLKKLNMHLKKALEDLDLNDRSYTNFKTVGEVVSAKLVMYNRRRTGELQAIKLTDYNNRKRCDGNILGQLSQFEKYLLESQEVMTVRGKTGRGVPVILPSETKGPLEFLTSPVVRKQADILDSNVYIFAANGNGVIRAYDALHKHTQKANLASPDRITSTNLRKYMATITQVLDLKESEMKWVVNHMGHTLDVHNIHYRATSEGIEATQVAKILLLQDCDKVGEFRGKSLEDIEIEELAGETQEAENVNALNDDMETSDYEEALEISCQFESRKTQKRDSSRASNAKGRWSVEEEKEIKKLFLKHFEKKKRPTPKECMQMIAKSKSEGGVIWKRSKTVLKKKLFRMIDKCAKV